MVRRLRIVPLRSHFKLDHDSLGRVLLVQRLRWDGAHTPLTYWHIAARVGTAPGYAKLRQILISVLASQANFRRCVSCGFEGLAGHFSDEACHSCEEHNGAVF